MTSGSDPARADVPPAAVLRYPAGPGPAQQVRESGAVQAGAGTGQEAAAREVAQGQSRS